MSWRVLLTKDFKKQNSLTDEELDEGVQRILDRLIFIRTAEDRKIEPNVLLGISRGGKANSYKQLAKVFRDFDDGFNSKLFAPHYCEEWKGSDKVIAEVIKGLYETKDGYRYDFSVISADVLGGIYEQYLGLVLEKSKKKSEVSKDENKRKSQGIYYTPKYIVEFIVRETLGKVLKKTKPKELSKIKVLDPACGSGSFLTAAYDKILETLIKQNPQTSLFSKFDILKDNIFGVDLDTQAVEIAQLNLLLKVLSQKTKLPTLQHNLRVGNSLISKGEEKHKPFNFETEFKEAFKQGGFDVVIGNPPYIKEDTNKSAFDGVHSSQYYQGKMDIWTLFACTAIDLLKVGGYFSFIAPSSWIGSAGASVFRKKIMTSGEIVKFIDFSDFRVFKDASIQTIIFDNKKKKPRKTYKVSYAKIENKNTDNDSVVKLLSSGLYKQIDGSVVYDATLKFSNDGGSINFSNDNVSEILNKIETQANYRLSKNDIGNGIDVLQDFVNEKHLLKLKNKTIKKGDGVLVLENSSASQLKLNEKEKSYLKPYYTTKQINRYLSVGDSEYKIIYADKYFRENIKEFPNLKAHIDGFKEILTSVFAPYGLHRPREEKFFK
ncbi:MAG: N-6 DNA methylase, partial [Actinobacteria bacterium]|nr:N-6 DNA methylase [Actinomycetota bacterium]